MNFSDRLKELPPYIFSEINAFKAEAARRGVQLLSLAIGDPDQPTPQPIIDKMKASMEKPENHAYSPYEGTLAFRNAVKDWFFKRFGVALDAEKEILALIGSKEGIAHFPIAFCNPGDKALYPSPGYPIFSTSLSLALAAPVALPLYPEKGFLPDLNHLEELLALHRPKYFLLNFPNNPTSVVCPRETLREIVFLAKKYKVILGFDNAYSEIYFDPKNRPPSILEIPEAKDVAIEFHSLSKTFNMTGWRIGFAVGNEELIAGLLRVKTNIDSGPLLAVQEASAFALRQGDELRAPIRKLYQGRRRILLEGLRNLNIEYVEPQATFYVWARVPCRQLSMPFAKALIETQGLIVTPGIGFGREGEYFFRMALTLEDAKLSEALEKLSKFLR